MKAEEHGVGTARSIPRGGQSTRRRVLQSILACAALPFAARAHAQGGTRASDPSSGARHAKNLPMAVDLAQDGVSSRSRAVPILLFFDRQDCPYCEQALREFLVPMANGEEWRDRALYRQVEIDQALPLKAFDGSATSHRAFAAEHRIELTPTIWMVDATGASLGKPLVGLMTLDFYGAYLEGAINDAAAKLARPS